MPTNRGYFYGSGSMGHILTTKDVMQELCHRAMTIANTRKTFCPDFGVTCGLRTDQEQLDLFGAGRRWDAGIYRWVVTDPAKIVTYCDGVDTRSVHQDGLAIDIYVVGDDEFDPAQLALVVTCFFEAADTIGIRIDWGGSFRSISDACHIEITEN